MGEGTVFGNMTIEQAITIRNRYGFTREAFACELGLDDQEWSAVEAGDASLRRIHIHAIERIALHYASISDPSFAPDDIKRDAVKLVQALKDK